MAVEHDGVTSYYDYDPSFTLAAIVAILYLIPFLLNIFFAFKYKSSVWSIMIIANGMETVGYAARALSTKHQTEKTLYTVQFALIVLAPVLMAGVCYVLFGRIIFHVVPKESRTAKLLWMPARFITPVFVTCDVVALLLQLTGAVMITSVDPSDKDAAAKENRGKVLAIIGVAWQLIAFGFFSLIAIRFNFTSKLFIESFESRLSNMDEKYCLIDGQHNIKKNWQAILRVCNFASAMILIRSVYRMVDFSMGHTGYTERHEWCPYVFDALPIYPVVALFCYWVPGKYLPYLRWKLPKYAQ